MRGNSIDPLTAVQQWCGFALCNLAQSQEQRAAIAAAGGIDVLTAAMRAHPAVGGVQDWCGYALGGLAESEEPRAAIAAAGGIDVLIVAMRAHPAAVQWCGYALGRLAAGWRSQRSTTALRLQQRVALWTMARSATSR